MLAHHATAFFQASHKDSLGICPHLPLTIHSTPPLTHPPLHTCRYDDAVPGTLPAPWHERLASASGSFTRLLLLRLLREDALPAGVQAHVTSCLGATFTEPEVWTLDDVFEQSSARVPIILILASGALYIVPLASLRKLSTNSQHCFTPHT